jgi:hypothetical protein
MNRFQRPSQKQGRLLVARRPSTFTVHALPRHLELGIDQDDGFGASAARAHDAMLIEHVGNGDSSVHIQLVGSVVRYR